MDINPSDIAKIQHNEWLKHPSTLQMFRLFELRKLHTIKKMSQVAYSEPDDKVFRSYAIEILLMDTLIDLIKSTDRFVEQLNK